jgi:hypothetical protein
VEPAAHCPEGQRLLETIRDPMAIASSIAAVAAAAQRGEWLQPSARVFVDDAICARISS